MKMCKWIFVNFQTGELLQLKQETDLKTAIEIIGKEKFVMDELVAFQKIDDIKYY